MMGIVRRRAVGRRIVRTAATTAVVVGTAHAVGGAMNKGQQQQQYEQAPAAEPQVVYVQQPAEQIAAPAAPAEEDVTVQLQKYAKMHDAGILTDEEFAAVKAKLLGI